MSTPSAATVCEVEFGLQDSRYPFVGISENESCRLDLAEMVPRPDGRCAEYFQVRGVAPARAAACVATEEAVEATIVTEYDDGGCLEFLVSGDCPAHRLAELGALPREVCGKEGDGRLTAEIPSTKNPSDVIATFLNEHPDATLLAKRKKKGIAPRFADSGVRELLHDHLTDRQREILRRAFEEGYYDWPRECTGEEIAAELGISSATFSEHIRVAERKLLAVLFDGPEPGHR